MDIGVLDPSTGEWENVTKKLDLGPPAGGIDFDSWAPADRSLLFHSLENLYEVGVNGSLVSKIPIAHLQISSATRFSLSADRKLLLFDTTIDTTERPLNDVISILDVSTNKYVTITPDTIEGTRPLWLPSEREILFTCLKRFAHKGTSICKIGIDGTGMATMITNADYASYSSH